MLCQRAKMRLLINLIPQLLLVSWYITLHLIESTLILGMHGWTRCHLICCSTRLDSIELLLWLPVRITWSTRCVSRTVIYFNTLEELFVHLLIIWSLRKFCWLITRLNLPFLYLIRRISSTFVATVENFTWLVATLLSIKICTRCLSGWIYDLGEISLSSYFLHVAVLIWSLRVYLLLLHWVVLTTVVDWKFV